jgi:hypothetical protein
MNLIKQNEYFNNTNDYEYGEDNENLLLNKIKMKFGDNIIKSSKYKYYDFKNEIYRIELKSRKYHSYDLNDVFLNTNKINKFNKKNIDNNLIFVFVAHLIDKDYYIIYDKEFFKKYKITTFKNKLKSYSDKLYMILLSDMIEF